MEINPFISLSVIYIKFMKKFGKVLGFGVGFFLPVLAFAQQISFTETKGLFGVLNTIQRLLNVVIPILITLGVVYFIWGVIKYVTAKDEEAQKEARSTMIYGIIGLFVIVSIWGLVGLLGRSFGIGAGGGAPGFPTVTPSTNLPGYLFGPGY